MGKTLKELNVRAKLGVNIIAIRRDGKITVTPGADDPLHNEDVLVLLGGARQLDAVQKL